MTDEEIADKFARYDAAMENHAKTIADALRGVLTEQNQYQRELMDRDESRRRDAHRDAFAMRAMHALIETVPAGETVPSEMVAKAAYYIADAMLQARGGTL